MSIAEIYGKISASGNNISDKREDLLTSDVFSVFKYTDENIVMRNYLERSKNINNAFFSFNGEITKTKYFFWPHLARSEPDLIIEISTTRIKYIILIEAKYLSGKSSKPLDEELLVIAETPRDQLAREYLDLIDYPSEKDNIRVLIYVTAHRVMPVNDILETCNEIKFIKNMDANNYIFWNTWYNLKPIFEAVNKESIDRYQCLILSDLEKLLQKKGLVAFNGFILNKIKTITNSYFSNVTNMGLSDYQFKLKKIKRIVFEKKGEIYG